MNVNILPAKTDLGAILGNSLGLGLSRGYERHLQQQDLKAQQKAQQVQRSGFADKIVNQIYGNQPPEVKQQLTQALSGLDPKDQIKGLEQLMTAQIMNQYLAGQQGQGIGSGTSQELGTQTQGQIPAVGSLQGLANQQQQEKKLDQKTREFAHSKTEKYSEKLAEDARQGEEMKYGVRLIKDALKSGKTGPTARNLAQKYLESAKSPLSQLFATPESGKINIGAKTLAGGFKQIMGSKPTEREFFWYENILPGLLKNIETNEAIVDYFDKMADFSIEAQDAADEVIKENGGYRPIDLDVKVRERMRPRFNSLISEGMGLLGETENGSEKGKKQTVFTELPNPKSYKGKFVKDQETGKRYSSDGTAWHEVP